MSLADLSIKRPIFITCVVLVMLAVGLLCMARLGVDLFPDVTFPVVVVTTDYPGAGPSEIETLVTKPLEDEISTLSGIKRLTSVNREGLSQRHRRVHARNRREIRRAADPRPRGLRPRASSRSTSRSPSSAASIRRTNPCSRSRSTPICPKASSSISPTT